METRPNILFIMADQFRADWLGCAGFPISTPQIDRIAARGTRFTRASCVCPLCTPSRAALATGRYPHNTGVQVHDASLPLDAVTYYQLLRRNGYRVAAVGKTDLHKNRHEYGERGDLPFMYHMGFTDLCETEGKMNAAWPAVRDGVPGPAGPYQRLLTEKGWMQALTEDYLDRLRSRPPWYASPSVLPPELFHDRFIGETACEMLRSMPGDSPWHLFVSFAGPHDPWDPPECYLDRYRDAQFPPSIPPEMEGKPAWIRKRAEKQTGTMDPEGLINMKRHYAGSIAVIDEWVGHILDTLEERGEAGRTVVVFAADHGEMMADHGLVQKSVMYEGALRIPLIVALPGQGPAESGALAELLDLAPTFLELAGVQVPPEMDGVSLLPHLLGRQDVLKPFQLSELSNCQMLFDGRYKWIRNWNDRDELYDLLEDPDELDNRIDRLPEVVGRMQKYTFRQ